MRYPLLHSYTAIESTSLLVLRILPSLIVSLEISGHCISVNREDYKFFIFVLLRRILVTTPKFVKYLRVQVGAVPDHFLFSWHLLVFCLLSDNL